MVLAQHAVLLDFVGTGDGYALYQSDIEGLPPIKVLMPQHTYDDMGAPEQVTVAVRPGSAFTDLDAAFQTPPAPDGE